MQKQIEMQEQQLQQNRIFQEALLSHMYKLQEDTVQKVRQELQAERAGLRA